LASFKRDPAEKCRFARAGIADDHQAAVLERLFEQHRLALFRVG
jgi:hypothetical protein